MGKRGYILILIVLSLLLASCSRLTKTVSNDSKLPDEELIPSEDTEIIAGGVPPEETIPLENELPALLESTPYPPLILRSGGGGGGGGGGGVGSSAVTVGGGGTETIPAAPEAPVVPATTSDDSICTNAQNDNLCDGLDVAYGEGYKALCCSEHGACC